MTGSASSTATPRLTPCKAWDGLLGRAMLGERAGTAPVQVDGPVGDLLRDAQRVVAGAPGSDATPLSDAERTLIAAGVLDVYRRAGLQPTTGSEAIEPADDDANPAASPRAGAVLVELLARVHRTPLLLHEWLKLAAAHQKRIPHHLLPAMLELSCRERRFRAPIAAVIDQRGRWLANLNSDWRPLLQDTSPLTAFEEGDLAARTEALRELRKFDPEAARGHLELAWPEYSPEERAALLPPMQTGLSMADEPFLETILDDRRKPVRRAAADLLASLPGSRMVQRMFARLTPLLEIEEGSDASNRKLIVRMPEACDKAMQRDGVEPKPPVGRGERSYWLLQMLSVVPPAQWETQLALEPEALIAAAAASDFPHLVREGWLLAAARHGATAWGDALVPLVLRKRRREIPSHAFAAVSARVRADALRELLSGDRNWEQLHFAMMLLQDVEEPWDATLGEVLIAYLASSTAGAMDPRDLVDLTACRLPLPQLDAAIERWQESVRVGSGRTDSLQKGIATLILRRDMHKELAS